MLNYFSTKQKILLILMFVFVIVFIILALLSSDSRYLYSGAGTLMWMMLYLYTTWYRGYLTDNVNIKIRELNLSKHKVMELTRSTKMEITGEVETGLSFFMDNKKLKSFDQQLNRMITDRKNNIK
ncbi:hypothetical protein [Macrococcus animalis]|uniref:hypothetical protein n=1 Tax=Macrococcus animalis TaxID=3395467 RepID=UPI0039BE1225